MAVMASLSHLVPDFAAMAAGNGSISDLFWLALATIFLVSCLFVLIHYVNFRRRIGAVKSLIKGRRKEGLAESRREVNASAAALRDRTAGALWREFDESLVASTDQTLLYNTLDAEHFFNGRTMARGLTASRLLAAAPSFLVAIGVLGTFVGLSFGLVGLDVSSDDIGELRDGINQMIKGASLAFLTSVWGVFLSLLLNFGEKLAERSALQRTHKLQQEIDFLYPRIPAEQSLVHIADSSKESSDALKHLHEKIGVKLQETMQSMSAEMQSAIADSITKVMGPAIEALSNSANTQSSELIEKLMQRFIDAIGARGEGAAKDLGNAGDKVGSAVSDLREQIKSLTSLTMEQQGAAAQASKDLHELMARQIKEQSDAARGRETDLTDRMSALMKDFIEHAQQQTDSSGRADEARVERARKMMDDMMASMSERDSGLNASLKDTLAILAASAQASQQGAEKIMSEQSSLIERLSAVTAGVSESSRQMAGASASASSFDPPLGGAGCANASALTSLIEHSEMNLDKPVTGLSIPTGFSIRISEPEETERLPGRIICSAMLEIAGPRAALVKQLLLGSVSSGDRTLKDREQIVGYGGLQTPNGAPPSDLEDMSKLMVIGFAAGSLSSTVDTSPIRIVSPIEYSIETSEGQPEAPTKWTWAAPGKTPWYQAARHLAELKPVR